MPCVTQKQEEYLQALFCLIQTGNVNCSLLHVALDSLGRNPPMLPSIPWDSENPRLSQAWIQQYCIVLPPAVSQSQQDLLSHQKFLSKLTTFPKNVPAMFLPRLPTLPTSHRCRILLLFSYLFRLRVPGCYWDCTVNTQNPCNKVRLNIWRWQKHLKGHTPNSVYKSHKQFYSSTKINLEFILLLLFFLQKKNAF